MSETKIAFHGCDHDDQDRRYGPQQRVFNKANPARKVGKPDWVCTVCGKGEK